MITMFNRKELKITQSMKEWGRVRGILVSEGIDYSIHTKNLYGGGRMGRSTLPVNSDSMYEYKIYVHKKDYERAYYLIHKKYVC